VVITSPSPVPREIRRRPPHPWTLPHAQAGARPACDPPPSRARSRTPFAHEHTVACGRPQRCGNPQKEAGPKKEAGAERVKHNPAWRYFELNTGHNLHDLHDTGPEDAVRILDGLAREA
jgi:hypothetical protein